MSILSSLTLVKVFRGLACVTAVIGATFLLGGAFTVMITTLHAGCREAAGPFWEFAGALLHCQDRLEEVTAGHTLPVLPGEHPLLHQDKSMRNSSQLCIIFHWKIHIKKKQPYTIMLLHILQ